MKKLSRKVFWAIFLIISIFIVSGVIIYNFSSYTKEYDNVKRNLTFMENKKDEKYAPDNPMLPIEKDVDNMMIMDYEVYTVKLNNKEIERIISHSSESDSNAKDIAEAIINKDEGIKIGNLYNNRYSYNYSGNTITIINTENINNRLLFILIRSIIILFIVEVIIYFVSKKLTKRITKPAKEAFDKQRDFIADASHELKTPLAVIMASSDELKSDKKNTKYIENIKYESERMNTLIKSLLDLSKLDSSTNINYKEENISKIVEKTSLIFEAVAFENNVLINTNIEDNINFRCNKAEMERLISIILDNAIKHSYKKSVIDVNLNKEKNNIIIKIINTGDPIKPDDEEKIFERFYRGDKSRNRDKNRYGLGLAIAKSIVNNHGGIIKAYSEDRKTTFKIILKK